MNQQQYIGFASINQLSSVISRLDARKFFLVTGKNSYHTSGAEENLNRILAGYQTERFSDFSNNPKAEDAIQGVEVFRQSRCDAIIAVGGGSIIDMAKLINFFACNNIKPAEYISSKAYSSRKCKPLIAIPTTSGTGSEATRFAVFYMDKKKFSVDDKYVLPDVAIVDPALSMSLPGYVTATSGMDALSQAIESYWSIEANITSQVLAKEAIELIISNLVDAVNSPTASARLAMAGAANLSGKAINITRTNASHAVSYPLTSYFGIPHGHAVALTLPSMLEYNAGVTEQDLQDSRGCEYVRKTISEIAGFLGQSDIISAKEGLTNLMDSIGLQTRLSELGVSSAEDIELIAGSFNPARAANNPRKITKESLRKILKAIF